MEQSIYSDRLIKGKEPPISQESRVLWSRLNQQFLLEARLHKNFPNYIEWGKFNKLNGGLGDGLVIDNMGRLISEVFSSVPITHVIGIENSGIPLARKVHEYFDIAKGPGNIGWNTIQKTFELTDDPDRIFVKGESYTNPDVPCYFGVPILEPESIVLLIDDVAAKGGALIPSIKGLIQQEKVELGGSAVGFDKTFQLWTWGLDDLRRESYYFPAFSVVRIHGIEDPPDFDGRDFSRGKIRLVDQRTALQII